VSTFSYITSIGTANPPYVYEQKDLAQFMTDYMELSELEEKGLKRVYENAGIRRRFSVLPDFTTSGALFFSKQAPEPTVAERMRFYEHAASPLAAEACRKAMGELRPEEITHLVTVSCTGMYAPGIDIDLIRALKLSPGVHRTAINFMGCYAAFNALKVADAICRADASACVLLVCVELCSIHFQKRRDKEQLISQALFADGAAAAIIQAAPQNSGTFRINRFECAVIPDEGKAMAWNVGNTAFDMILSSYVPALIQTGIDRLLSSYGIPEESELHYAIHPGGKKILEAVKEARGLTEDDLWASYKILSEYGNMSSPTVLFVLRELSEVSSGHSILSAAFGPGLTMESMYLTKL
jgi:predicted naringenin-chalcone synthase